MPALAAAFAEDVKRALDFACSMEEARDALDPSQKRALLGPHKLELGYELAYLRIFIAWEDFLEQSFLRYLCGYSALHGQEQPISGSYCSDLANAKSMLYGSRSYLLWHNPQKVIQRASRFFHTAKHETVVASMQMRIEHYAAIRHRIAHAHARLQFDAATAFLVGRRIRGARPGRFLRMWAQHSPMPMRWIDSIALELRQLAFQIVPA